MEKASPKKTIRKTIESSESVRENLSPKEIDQLIRAIEAAGIQEFSEYIRSPLKMMWPNFVAGIARGFGALVGVAVVIGGIGWIFAVTIDLPLIGKRLEPYIIKAQSEMNRYIEQTNYEDEFRNLENTLKAIEKNTTPKN